MPRPSQVVTLRLAAADDLPRVRRLAALDSARPPLAPVLLAEVDDELCVAVSLVDLKAVADPFRLTDEIRSLAVARATQAARASGAATALAASRATRGFPLVQGTEAPPAAA
jgi:hypothetical protein